MNAESTYVRPTRPRPRPTIVAPGGDGAGLAALVLALPMRVAATPLGRRVLAAATIAVVLVSLVGALYDHTDRPRPASALAGAQATASHRPATGGWAGGSAKATGRKRSPAEAAAAWYAGKQRVALDHVQALGQRRLSASERQVLVVAEASGSKLATAYVVVRKGPGGWAAVS